ncbi:hypothetical protein E2C01_047976 [Portunus trituberculatus]|uniref:Uncharacterized protein n=1 Tax=Portunus trituberculatus TaxID=210409 RepID=A0A5B7G8Y0_PORTR|nr:hypothetical protein [Portunus trituberculatus]
MRLWSAVIPWYAARSTIFLRNACKRSCPREPQVDRHVHAPAYLEAYELMEENADMIFDPQDMMSERAYDCGKSVSKGNTTGQPRPASDLPGPRAWPIVGCLPYMMRHPGTVKLLPTRYQYSNTPVTTTYHSYYCSYKHIYHYYHCYYCYYYI